MTRLCPICPQQPLRVVQANDLEIDVCPRCHGLWFDEGELDALPERPSTRGLAAQARLKPSRCPNGHLVAKGTRVCSDCGKPPCRCPACKQPLSLWPIKVCTIDVCADCGGIWLDHGELEALEGATSLKLAPTLPEPKWEVPAPASDFDPWVAPGHREPVRTRDHINPRVPFDCRHCSIPMSVHTAFAFDGDVYCEVCRPEGAVSSADLPTDPRANWDENTLRMWGPLWTWGWSLLSRFVRAAGRVR